jgi:hypothetical protein
MVFMSEHVLRCKCVPAVPGDNVFTSVIQSLPEAIKGEVLKRYSGVYGCPCGIGIHSPTAEKAYRPAGN